MSEYPNLHHALITGGNRGIGLAIVQSFLAKGTRVTVMGRHGGDELKRLGANFIQIDLRYPERLCAIENLDADILINNAGNKVNFASLFYPLEYFLQDLNLMVVTPFLLAGNVGKFMVDNQWGRIVNICSISSFQGARQSAGYVAAKHALLGLTRALSTEWAVHGITVNAIAPGFIETRMLNSKPDLGRIPMGRIGTPEEVAHAVDFLCSDEAGYITGACLPVDGGWLAR